MITAFIMSCDGREKLLDKTIASLANTDWQDKPIVFKDQSGESDRVKRIAQNSELLLDFALSEPSWAYMLFLEDDVDFNFNIRHNIESWWPYKNKLSFGSLYNPKIDVYLNDARRHFSLVDPRKVYGSQAFLISRSCAEYLRSKRDVGGGMQDTRWPQLAGEKDTIFYHTPSLVQHVGYTSTWGGRYHQADDYDKHFKA